MPESSSKKGYRHLCNNEDTVPIFSRDWWLDAVCERSTWDAVVAEQGGKIVGAMPYCFSDGARLKMLGHPPLTQTLGPWIRPCKGKYAKALARQKDIMLELIDRLPPFDHFSQNWHYSNTNWLPFYWRGFSQTTRYTYVLPDLSDEDAVWSGFLDNIRTDIRKAEKRLQLQVRDDLDIADFMKLNRMTFFRQDMELPYSESVVRRMDSACAERRCRKIFIAEDAEGRMHAGVYIVWDEQSAYYLMGGSDPALRNSGATSLCMWHAIKHAATVTKGFDFEGSMIEAVERYFRAFGAVQVPYSSVSRTPSRYVRWRRGVSAAIKRR